MSVNCWYEPERSLEPPEPEDYVCPVCLTENPEYFFVDTGGQILGCDNCIEAVDAAQRVYDDRNRR